MPENTKNAVGLKILRQKDVTERTGISRSSIYDKMNPRSPRHDPTFPRQRKLGPSTVGWLEADINAWIASRFSESHDDPSLSAKTIPKSKENESLPSDFVENIPPQQRQVKSPPAPGKDVVPVQGKAKIIVRTSKRILLGFDGKLLPDS